MVQNSSTELHVSVRSPFWVRCADRLVAIQSFDGMSTGTHNEKTLLFRTRYLYACKGGIDDGRRIDMRIDVFIAPDNIAAIVPQPYPKDK